jgi:hypothetical protein
MTRRSEKGKTTSRWNEMHASSWYITEMRINKSFIFVHLYTKGGVDLTFTQQAKWHIECVSSGHRCVSIFSEKEEENKWPLFHQEKENFWPSVFGFTEMCSFPTLLFTSPIYPLHSHEQYHITQAIKQLFRQTEKAKPGFTQNIQLFCWGATEW